jgi:hypothetical protein
MRGGRQKLVVRLAAGLALAGALAVVLALAATPSHAGTRAPHVLASFPRPLLGFAEDGNRIAWAIAPCGSIVAIRDLASGSTWTVKDHGAECWGGGALYGFDGIALGGRRAIWSTFTWGNDEYTSLETAVVGSRANTVLGETNWGGPGGCGGGDVVQALSADGETAVYSYVHITANLSACKWNKVLGGIYSVAPHRKIGGIPPAYALAVGDGVIAAIPVDTNAADMQLTPGPTQRKVYLYDTRTRSIRTVTARGTAREVAVSGSVLAVLVKLAGHNVIERFQTRNGAVLGSTPVPSASKPRDLSVSGKQVVYSTGREIWLLDGLSGKRTLITTAGGRPIGLSVEGKRVYWGENRGHRGSILTLTLP